MWRKIVKFFDELEDKTRKKLSHHPMVYAFLGGVGVVLFWRGVWHLADEIEISSIISIILGTVILLITGVFVSAFIGNRLIISGLSGSKKLTEMAEEEIAKEENQIKKLQETLEKVSEKIADIEFEAKEYYGKDLEKTLDKVAEKAADIKSDIKNEPEL